ncbi:MAG: hypothetical protein PHV47_01210 [Candidatus Pacebacteria bacterium]|nr:hypothetical protein [Candidatus Paceibacterota bacterium]
MKKLLIAASVVAFVAFFVNASELDIIAEGSLLFGDQSAFGALVGAIKVTDNIGIAVSGVSLGLPDWDVVTCAFGGGYWWHSGFLGGGIILPSLEGGFATILAWNEKFYGSGLVFQKNFSDFYVRVVADGLIGDNVALQGRIEGTSNASFSSTMSWDGGFFVRSSSLLDELPSCLWLGLGGEVAWRECWGQTSHVERGIRVGVRVDLACVRLDFRVFVVRSNDGSSAWGVEIALLSNTLFRRVPSGDAH